MWFKRHSKMHSVSCTNTHTDLVNHGMVKNTKTWISWERNKTFLLNKKILNLCLRWHILRNYRQGLFQKDKASLKLPRFLRGKNVFLNINETYQKLLPLGGIQPPLVLLDCLSDLLSNKDALFIEQWPRG